MTIKPLIQLSPCKDCPDREVGCHGKCEKYINYQKENSEVKKYIAKEKKKNNVLNSHQIEEVRKTKRRKGIKC